jgi:sporulation protein YlmC with PRC-barrel domain
MGNAMERNPNPSFALPLAGWPLGEVAMALTSRTAMMTAILAAATGVVGPSVAGYRDGLQAHGVVAQLMVASDDRPAVPPASEAAKTVVDKREVQSILGRQVVSSAGEDMGRVIDVVVDRNGQARAAVIDFGGFLGVGSRKIAVDWSLLRFVPTGNKNDRISLDLTRDQVKAAPEYKEGKPVVVLGAAEGLQSSQPPY